MALDKKTIIKTSICALLLVAGALLLSGCTSAPIYLQNTFLGGGGGGNLSGTPTPYLLQLWDVGGTALNLTPAFNYFYNKTETLTLISNTTPSLTGYPTFNEMYSRVYNKSTVLARIANSTPSLTGYVTYTGLYSRVYNETEINTLLTNRTNWNTAYSWGDHASEGYLHSSDLNPYPTYANLYARVYNETEVNNFLAAKLGYAQMYTYFYNKTTVLARIANSSSGFSGTINASNVTNHPLFCPAGTFQYGNNETGRYCAAVNASDIANSFTFCPAGSSQYGDNASGRYCDGAMLNTSEAAAIHYTKAETLARIANSSSGVTFNDIYTRIYNETEVNTNFPTKTMLQGNLTNRPIFNTTTWSDDTACYYNEGRNTIDCDGVLEQNMAIVYSTKTMLQGNLTTLYTSSTELAANLSLYSTTTVENARDAAAEAYFLNKSKIMIVDDFLYWAGTRPALGGLAISSGTAAAVTSKQYHRGLAYLRDSTTANGGFNVASNGAIMYFQDGDEYTRIDLCLPATSNRLNTTMFIGFHDATSVTQPTDGCWFNVFNRNVQPRCKNNAGPTLASTNFTLITSRCYGFEVQAHNTTKVKFKIYNTTNERFPGTVVYYNNVSANVPNVVARLFGFGILVTQSTTDAAADIVWLDRLEVVMKG